MKTCLFFLLMTAATALLVLGANLWAQTQAQMDAVEKQFTTLGTVEQKPNRTQMRTGWDAADGAYYSEAEPVYDSVISADVLDFDGANYLKAPEKRPYYLADLQGLAVRDGGTALFYPVVEFTPAETAVPDHPIKVYVQRFLYPEAENQNNEYEIYVCDHWTENPAPLEAGKTYVAYTNVIVNHHENAKSSIEYALIAAERSTQCDAGGNLLESDRQTRTFDEVTAGFYETERGQYWLELSKALSMWDTTAPVLPVTDTALLPSFTGAHAIDDAFARGVKVTGVTVHFANEIYDNGPIIAQRALAVEEGWDVDTLEEHIHAIEHVLYPEVVQMLADGRVHVLESGKVAIDAPRG